MLETILDKRLDTWEKIVNAILLLHDFINLADEDLLEIILYGHEQLSSDSNAKILTATLESYQKPPNIFDASLMGTCT